MNVLGINASTIGSGGGITHLREIIAHANPALHGFEKVILWGSSKLLAQIPEKSWLEKRNHPLLEKSIFHKIFWQNFIFNSEVNSLCDIIFLPASLGVHDKPTVTICQNLLPFDSKERARYGFGLMQLRLNILSYFQKKCFHKAQGVIFLSQHSYKIVQSQMPSLASKYAIIPHGVDTKLFQYQQRALQPLPKPLKILYVSTIDVYKHQWNVAQACINIHKNDFPIQLTLIGSAYPKAEQKLQNVINKYPEHNIVEHLKGVSFHELPDYYANADIFILASTCETFGIILLEAMSSGLPVLSNDYETLKETIGENAIYFNAENVASIQNAIKQLLINNNLVEMAELARKKAETYTWQTASEKTFAYFAEILNKSTYEKNY